MFIYGIFVYEMSRHLATHTTRSSMKVKVIGEMTVRDEKWNWSLKNQRRIKLVAATNVYRSRDVKLDGYT